MNLFLKFFKKYFTQNSMDHPKRWFIISGMISLILIGLVALPSLSPSTFPYLSPLHIDTDPENMLSEHEDVRLFHNQMKKQFDLYDMVVVGVKNKNNSHGVFNPKSLNAIYTITNHIKTITWTENNETHGVIASDIIAPSTVDTINQNGLGTVQFEWLMQTPPQTQEEATLLSQKAKHIPFLDNTLISDDGKSLAIYVPIAFKKDSFKVAESIRETIATLDTDDNFYITGLPIAQDQFGIEMFKQMAVSAPLAMLLIFVLMWAFFRHIKFIIAPMVVAMVSVIITMGLLIITGNTVHIMSSMIPIFIMPIAVLDAVHILSDFFDRYPKIQHRQKTLQHVMDDLFKPMLFTSLTTCAGFGSLAFTPIPPVQVFGIFIGIGVFFAWLFTITLVPAYIMLLPESALESFGRTKETTKESSLQQIGRFTYNHYKLILVLTILVSVAAYIGITKIVINDNPVKWFEEKHDIRIADKELNEAFAGTYMSYLVLQSKETEPLTLTEKNMASFPATIQDKLRTYRGQSLDTVEEAVLTFQDESDTDEEWDNWENVLLFIDTLRAQTQLFKNPDVLRYVSQLQEHLLSTGLVGKSNGLPDVVKTVHRELYLGKDDEYRIPDSSSAVAQCLITYEGSHRPQDLWHFVTTDYTQTSLWIQLKSGDNKDMKTVIDSVNEFINTHKPPVQLQAKWFGLTYINVVWQEKMVTGMLESFLSSFVIVLIMMIFLFRSFWWGLLSMIPLTVTIAIIYGIIGFIGKDYDMPIAVLSALSLGLSVDYAIHFLARSRELYDQYGSWEKVIPHMFDEPARAIFRNVIVIGIGFTPLLAAPLVPYQTVGFFISSILISAGIATLFILPALIRLLSSVLFKKEKEKNNETI